MVASDFFKDKEVHYKSNFGSSYFYTEKGVYRYSNHWGRVANCRWKISGIEAYKNQVYYTGFANWTDFYALNSTEKVFYLEVDVEIGKTSIHKVKGTETSTHFLMTLNAAFKRQKEIKMVYKEYKWALYFNDSIENVRKKLVHQLINSNEPLQVLKQGLKNKL
jgi:citrate synthase